MITRACYLLECANFVHQCNRGHWPAWLKMNLPAYRPSRGQVLSTQPIQRRLQILQLQASKMFHQWAEVQRGIEFLVDLCWKEDNQTCFQMLSSRLEEKILQEQQVVSMVTDETRQRQLQLEDELEDFLDEASVNPTGSSCPNALKLVACLLLMEITTFLRECYRTLPKPARGRVSHFWGDGGGVGGGGGGCAPGAGGRSVTSTAAATGGVAGVTAAVQMSVSGRRWSMAAQSLAGGQSVVSQAAASVAVVQHHMKQTQKQAEAAAAMVPTVPEGAESTTALSPMPQGGGGAADQQRKISFVLQDDIQAVSTQQVREDNKLVSN